MRGNTVRKQVFVYAGIVLVLTAAAAIWFVFFQDSGDRLFDQVERVNVLLIARDDSQSADVITLLSFSEADAVLFSFPTNVRLRNAEGAFVQGRQLFADAGIEAVRDALQELLGLSIPFYVASEYAMIESWIEHLGGIEVELDAAAIYTDTTVDPLMRVEIRPGVQAFDAFDAILFATMPSEIGDVGRLKRQQALMISLLEQGIAQSPLRDVRQAVREVAANLETNLSTRDLLQVADALHAIPAGALRADELIGDIVEIDGVPYTQPNVVGTERLVAALLKGLELLTPGDVSVAVFNGNGGKLLARRTADYLEARGFQITGIGNAESFDYETSYVIVLSDESKAWVLLDTLPSSARIVFPETFSSHYEALSDYIPAGTDIVFVAGAGWEIE